MQRSDNGEAPGRKALEKAAFNKSIIKVLRFLARAGPEGAILSDGCDDERKPEGNPTPASGISNKLQLQLLRGDGRKIPMEKPILVHLTRAGAICRNLDAVALSADGRAALKRLLTVGGSGFGDQHRDLVWRMDSQGDPVQVNLAESPLGALARLKHRDGSIWFPAELIIAGDRLRADFTRGHYQPGMGVRFDNVGSRGSAARGAGTSELTDAAMAARLRMEKALASVGPELAGPLVDVCCYLKGLERVESERQWPRRSAKLMVRAGLERLARHYAPPESRKPAAKARHWGAAGYRPDLSGSQIMPGRGCT